MRLNQSKNLRSSPWLSFFGLSSSAASAGLSVSALNAERITEIAMVTANCWYSRPVMPGMNAVGTNTAESTSAMPITGPEISSIAFKAACFGRHAFFDVPLHGLHHDDGVVHHQSDRQHQSEQRERVDGESEQREEDERADQRNRHREQRNQRGAPALQEDVDHERSPARSRSRA